MDIFKAIKNGNIEFIRNYIKSGNDLSIRD